MSTILIRNAQIVNEGKIISSDVLIKNERIEKIAPDITVSEKHIEINAEGKYLMPGAIDDQVHFREPGLTHKATIYTESRAAVAGGITSFMEMPNTVPQAVTKNLLEEKYQIAAQNSLANYSFFMGTTNENFEEIMGLDLSQICGLKIFMGSSTGNMLVDNENVLEKIFARFPGIIALHCEDEQTIKNNLQKFQAEYGDNLTVMHHPKIRSNEACYISSSKAVSIAKKHGTRIHILHISTAEECNLFTNEPLEKKKITAEACVHHLWFSDMDYPAKGNFIKWNPAIKSENDKEAIWKALLDGRIDVVATDHAPHTFDEKSKKYMEAPSGGPLVQHAMQAMFAFHQQGKISIEKIAEKMSHHPAILFGIKERGFIREGYFADLVLVDNQKPYHVSKENILYKCGWSPFEDITFNSSITHTFVNGNLVYENGNVNEGTRGKRLVFSAK